jgi:hypothetical protein
MWGSRSDVDVADVQALDVPMELRLKLRAIVGLNDVNAKREAAPDFVDEANGGALVTRVVHLEDTNPRAIVDGGELIEPRPRLGDALEELDVQLQPVPR